MEKHTDKTDYLTLLGVLSALSVIVLHANTCFWNYAPERWWITANAIESVLYFPIPVFFMISGARLMDYRERYDTKTYAKKRFRKAVFPFLIWSAIGFIFYYKMDRAVFPSPLTFSALLSRFLEGFPDIYWFFPVLFLMYAAIPFLSMIPKEKRLRASQYAFLLFFLNESVIPFVFSLVLPDVAWPLSLGKAKLGYLMFLFLGYILSRVGFSKKARAALYAAALAGLLIHFFGTWILSERAKEVDETFKGYLNLPCVLYSAGIFVFFRQTGNRILQSFAGKIVRFLAPHTLSFYLMHNYLLFMILWAGNKLGLALETSIFYRLGAVFLVVPVCLLADRVIRKIPGLKRILP